MYAFWRTAIVRAMTIPDYKLPGDLTADERYLLDFAILRLKNAAPTGVIEFDEDGIPLEDDDADPYENLAAHEAYFHLVQSFWAKRERAPTGDH